jgi:ATP-dependent Clp protease ATP-binding subunit ClpC
MPNPATNVLHVAHAEAVALGHEAVGTEHVLLALAALAEEPTARALAARGVYVGTLRTQVRRLTVPGPSEAPVGKLPHTPGVKRVIERTVWEARTREHNFICPTHLALALLDTGSTIAADALRTLGVAPEVLRADVLRDVGWTDPDL